MTRVEGRDPIDGRAIYFLLETEGERAARVEAQRERDRLGRERWRRIFSGEWLVASGWGQKTTETQEILP